MCTVIALFGVVPDVPLLVAHNRDELLARPTVDVDTFVPLAGRPPVLAGRDQVSGGTWFAIGPRVMACVTNDRRTGRSMPGAVSRGTLVAHLATAPTLDDGLGTLAALEPEHAGPFHLLVSDGQRLVHVANGGPTVRVVDVAPGLHVLGNFGLDDADDPVVANLHARLSPLRGSSRAVWADALKDALREHGPGRPCVHGDIYGTRSAGLAALFGADEAYASTSGPSCTHPWRDHGPALAAVRGLETPLR